MPALVGAIAVSAMSDPSVAAVAARGNGVSMTRHPGVRLRDAIIRPSIRRSLPAERGYADGVQMHHQRRALLFGVGVTLIATACAGLLAAAVLVPAPHAALPFLILTCIACPMAAAFELANA